MLKSPLDFHLMNQVPIAILGQLIGAFNAKFTGFLKSTGNHVLDFLTRQHIVVLVAAHEKLFHVLLAYPALVILVIFFVFANFLFCAFIFDLADFLIHVVLLVHFVLGLFPIF